MGVFDTASDLQWGASSAFRGAEITRLYADRWRAVNHPDTEIQYALRNLRAASRDLVRNNPYAAGVVEALADNINGWEGIRCRPRITDPPNDPRGELVREVNWEIDRGWREWAEEYATVDGVESWLETERLISKSWGQDGEIFVRRRRGWDNPHGYAIELIDPDLLDEDFNERRERRGREIRMGVEIDEFGRPLFYHFWREHPDELGFRRERVPIPANEIGHFFLRYRPGQTRGFPLFAPVLTTVEMIDGYSEAELVAARVAASKMGFIKNTNQDAAALHAQRKHMQAERGKGDVKIRRKMAPATVDELEPGQEFEGFDPTHPNTAFDAFMKALLRGVSRGLHVSYQTLSGDVSDASYSNTRSGIIPERDHWKVLQNVVARRVHRTIYRDWISMALLSGAVDLPSPVASDYHAVEWHGRRWQWVDPENDLKAAEREVKLGLNSRQRLAADRGHDYETIIDESAEDQDYARSAGVFVGGVESPPPARRPSASSPSSNGNGQGAASRLEAYQLEVFDG